MEFVLIAGFIALVAFLAGRKSKGAGGIFSKDNGRDRER